MTAGHDAHFRSVKGRFGAAAGSYAAHAGLQARVAARVADMAAEAIRAPDFILDLGCGTGFLAGEIRRHFPHATLVLLDCAERMVAQAMAGPGGTGALGVVADFETFAARRRFPLVVSSAALHWATSLETAFANAARLNGEGGVLSVALMTRGTLESLHRTRAGIVPAKPARPLPGIPDVKAALERAGYEVRSRMEAEDSVWYPDTRTLLQALHAQGLTGGGVSGGRQRLARHELEQLIEAHDRVCRESRGVCANYRILYVSAVCRTTNPARGDQGD